MVSNTFTAGHTADFLGTLVWTVQAAGAGTGGVFQCFKRLPGAAHGVFSSCWPVVGNSQVAGLLVVVVGRDRKVQC